MTHNTGAEHRAAPDTALDAEGCVREPNWPLALASVGICLGSGAVIALIAILA